MDSFSSLLNPRRSAFIFISTPTDWFISKQPYKSFENEENRIINQRKARHAMAVNAEDDNDAQNQQSGLLDVARRAELLLIARSPRRNLSRNLKTQINKLHFDALFSVGEFYLPQTSADSSVNFKESGR